MEELNVAAQIKVYVDSPDDMASVKKGIEKLAKVNKMWEEDVGFGIKALKANLLLSDAEGGMEKLEASIRKLKGVSEFEVETVTRV